VRDALRYRPDRRFPARVSSALFIFLLHLACGSASTPLGSFPKESRPVTRGVTRGPTRALAEL